MFVKTFKQISKNDVREAGGKGASLGEMTRAGIPVPPGFVVLSNAFNHFLEETNLGAEIEAAMHSVDGKDINSVEGASVKIRSLVEKTVFPKDIAAEVLTAFKQLKAPLVAVRSSATAEDSKTSSWAGELESYLNVDGKNLLERVKNCWASLFTPRAIFYRFEKNLHKQSVSVAVVVQKMVQSEVSGIAFTVNPVTKDHDQMVIEAGWGLGEAIVGGKITPDTFIVHKHKNGKFDILDKNVSEQEIMVTRGPKGVVETRVPEAKRAKQKLSDELVLKLAELCTRIEKHYGYPQDVEWAFEKGKFYVTQARPITTL